MKLILKEDVPKLGESGDEVKVKPGFARNFLIPRGIADVATPRNVKLMQHKKRLIQRQIDAARAEVEEVKLFGGEAAPLKVTVIQD